jgi:hypothetical protein
MVIVFDDLLQFHAEAIGCVTPSSTCSTPRSLIIVSANVRLFSNRDLVRYKLANVGTGHSTFGE